MTFESEKRQFAQALIDGLDAGRAAFKVFPTDGANRMKAILQWEKDTEVIAYTKEILGIKEPQIDKREAHIQKLNDIFDDEDVAPRDRLVASMQIAQIEGFIAEKVEKNTTINNKILIIPRSATNEEWEKSIKEQQEKLVADTLVVKEVDITDVSEEENDT
jgi:hypothetical protein